MNSRGFTLIELLVATAISAMIAVLLFSSFSQTNRTVRRVDNAVDIAMRAIVASHQLERDLAGAFVPVEGQRKSAYATASADKPAKANEDKSVSAGSSAKEDVSAGAMAKAEKAGKISKIFFGSTKDGMLDTLTFISNNPTIDPICVNRVVYKLVPEKIKKKEEASYALMRQEGTQLELDAYANTGEKAIRSYELVGHIKKLTVVYTAAVVKEKVERKGNQEIKTIETEYKVYNDWNMEEEIKQPIKPDQPRRRLIPYAVDINFTLWDAQKKQSRLYTVKTVILPDAQEFEEEAQKVNQPLAPQQPATQQMGQPNNAQQQQKRGGIAGLFPGLTQKQTKKPQTAFDKIPSVISTLLGVRDGKQQTAEQMQIQQPLMQPEGMTT